MSTKDPNMKVIFGSDTKDFEKGAKEVKQGLKDLDKTSASALAGIGSVFGVNTQKVEQMTSAMKGLGAKLTETGSAGVKAFGSILSSITPLGGAIAGIGIAGAIAGFKQLKSEAENFKSTIDGMNMSMATSAYISTYRQVLHDVNSDTGKAVAQAMDQWERGFGRFRANLGAAFVSYVSEDRNWYDLPITRAVRAWRQATAASDEAAAAADRNADRASQMADLMKEQLRVNNEIKVLDNEIAEARRIASDRSASSAERAAAEATYREKVNEKYDKQIGLQSRMLSLQQAMDGEASNTYEQTRKTAEMEGQLIDLETARTNELRTIDRLSNSISTTTAAQAAAAKKAREEAEKMAQVQSKWAGLGTVSTEGLSSLQGGVEGPAMSILLHPKLDEKEVIDISRELASLVEQGVTSVSESIGTLIGDLVTGGDAWANFANNALSAFGDMAIAVGKMAIGTGVATIGIKKALESLNGYVAIAAGAALVALGAAVKSGLSNVASGDYSAAGGGYSGSYASSGGGDGYETREVQVNVTGTLVANGDQLVTVINNTNKKNYYLGGE